MAHRGSRGLGQCMVQSRATSKQTEGCSKLVPEALSLFPSLARTTKLHKSTECTEWVVAWAKAALLQIHKPCNDSFEPHTSDLGPPRALG